MRGESDGREPPVLFAPAVSGLAASGVRGACHCPWWPRGVPPEAWRKPSASRLPTGLSWASLPQFPQPWAPRALLSGCLWQRGDSSEFGGTWPVVPCLKIRADVTPSEPQVWASKGGVCCPFSWRGFRALVSRCVTGMLGRAPWAAAALQVPAWRPGELRGCCFSFFPFVS